MSRAVSSDRPTRSQYVHTTACAQLCVLQRFFDFVTRDLPESGKANVLRWMCGSTDFIGNWHEQFNLEVMRLARELDVPLIDLTTPFLVRQDYFTLICRDGIHPNEGGHQLMAGALKAQWPF